ncbi:unnamed protein product, partial [Owenia fusiformis]
FLDVLNDEGTEQTTRRTTTSRPTISTTLRRTTTDRPITTAVTTEPLGGDALPSFFCDFDDGICNMSIETNVEYVWLRQKGRTSTGETGPSGDRQDPTNG